MGCSYYCPSNQRKEVDSDDEYISASDSCELHEGGQSVELYQLNQKGTKYQVVSKLIKFNDDESPTADLIILKMNKKPSDFTVYYNALALGSTSQQKQVSEGYKYCTNHVYFVYPLVQVHIGLLNTSTFDGLEIKPCRAYYNQNMYKLCDDIINKKFNKDESNTYNINSVAILKVQHVSAVRYTCRNAQSDYNLWRHVSEEMTLLVLAYFADNIAEPLNMKKGLSAFASKYNYQTTLKQVKYIPEEIIFVKYTQTAQ